MAVVSQVRAVRNVGRVSRSCRLMCRSVGRNGVGGRALRSDGRSKNNNTRSEGPAANVFATRKTVSSSTARGSCIVTHARGSAISGTLIDDTTFNIAQVSLGTIGSIVGVVLLTYGFTAYFGFVPGGGASAVILTYGFPITILGFALKYAELKPVECETYDKAAALRDIQATPIQRQVKDDVTRFRYGDEQHLDLALERIFRIGRGGGLSRRDCPVLTAIREEVAASTGTYALVLEFDSKKLGLEKMSEYREKFQSFFGPGITAEIKPSFPPTESGVEFWLISEGDEVGGQVVEDDVLPPLMPGLPARSVPRVEKTM